MAARKRALTRNITREQALSYEKALANVRGVTTLSEVNGPGAYRRRYEATRQMLAARGRSAARANAEEKPMAKTYTAAQKRAMKKMGPKRARAFKKMLAAAPDISAVRRGRKRRAKPNRALPPPRGKARKAYARGYERVFGKPKKKAKKRKLTKAERAAISRRNLKKARAALRAKARAAGKKPAPKARTYGKGRYRALKARIGPTSRQTFLYRTKKGNVRHVPEHAVLGYPSARAMKLSLGSAAGQARYQKKKASLESRRARDAERAAARARAGKGIFTPNPGAEVLSFEEWKDMYKSNPKRKTRKKAAKKRKGRKLTKAERAVISRRNLRKARAAKKRGVKGKKRAAPKKRRVARAKSLTITMRANATPAQVAAARRNIRKAQAARWRANAEMRYEENPAGAFVADMKGAIKIGTIVLVGYMGHRALTKVLGDFVLGKVEAFQTGSLAKWRDTIAGIITAAIGVPLAVKVVPRESAAAGAGIAASLLHSLIVTALAEANQPKVAEYLSNYPNASGVAWPGIGSYYTYKPRQIYPAAGFGEYYSLGPGALTTEQLTAAAAGYQPMQAAAGMGALVTQAAAGEYLVYGAEGVGDNYEQVPTAAMPSYIDEGVAPNLYAAEQALNVMEAAAGVGMAEIPLQSTVEPLQYETPIGDEPGGSRAGIFQGGGGIFG